MATFLVHVPDCDNSILGVDYVGIIVLVLHKTILCLANIKSRLSLNYFNIEGGEYCICLAVDPFLLSSRVWEHRNQEIAVRVHALFNVIPTNCDDTGAHRAQLSLVITSGLTVLFSLISGSKSRI